MGGGGAVEVGNSDWCRRIGVSPATRRRPSPDAACPEGSARGSRRAHGAHDLSPGRLVHPRSRCAGPCGGGSARLGAVRTHGTASPRTDVEISPATAVRADRPEFSDGFYFLYPPFVAWITVPLASLSGLAAYLACVIAVLVITLLALALILGALRAARLGWLFAVLGTVASAPWNAAVCLGHFDAGLLISPALALSSLVAATLGIGRSGPRPADGKAELGRSPPGTAHRRATLENGRWLRAHDRGPGLGFAPSGTRALA